MGKVIQVYIYIFAVFSLSGWVLEFLFRSLGKRKITNPGFLYGPYLPIYGTGALLVYIASSHLVGSSIFIKILAYFIITTGIEFITGFVWENFFHIRLWDYSKEPLGVKNYVCLTFSFYWVILAFATEYLFFPAALYLYSLSPRIYSLSWALAFIMFIDGSARFWCLLVSKKRKNAAAEVDELQEFSLLIKPLLEEPKVAELANFRHHWQMTRLDHSMEVAWLSYIIAKRFSLDCAAVARGGLLHDLFYYEWLTEGPRLHGFRHPRICLENARKITVLSMKEEDIIAKHMWPLTFTPPRYIESWIVCFVDTYCTIKDYLLFFGEKEIADVSDRSE